MADEEITHVLIPQMGVTVFEATVIRWLKKVGDNVALDEPIVEISTDKVDTEVPSPGEGVLAHILVTEGETVAVGALIGVLTPDGPPPGSVETPSLAEEAFAPQESVAENNDAGRISPVVARIAREHGVDLATVKGTGRGGRITREDVLAADGAPPTADSVTPTVSSRGGAESEEPMSRMRVLIAEHMRRSLDTSAHLTTVFEVDMSQVVEIRGRLLEEREDRVKLTYLAFIARAAVEAMRNWPWMNGELRGEKIITRDYVNLGIAVALEGGKGLVVPVVKGAEKLPLVALAQAIEDLADRARSKRLLVDDVREGTFTVTNPGGFGSILGTPIINQPQVAILDIEAIVDRVVVVTDSQGRKATAIRPMMNLCLSFDHRLVDGAYAAQFLAEVRRNLESWGAEKY